MTQRLFFWGGLFGFAAFSLAACNGNAGGLYAPSSMPARTFSSPAAKAYETLYHFAGGTDGANPYAGLVFVNGDAYGTTYWGGDANGPSGGDGTVFKIDASGVQSTVYRFQGGKDGLISESGLTAGSGGALFGATDYGGGSTACQAGCGTIFELIPSGSGYTERVIHAFKGGNDGAVPIGTPVLDQQGNIYGTTVYGGKGACTSGSGVTGCGVVYKLVPSGSKFTEKVLHRFQGGSDGANPVARLTAVGKNAFYGTTLAGGTGATCSGGCGTVFRVTTSGGENVRYPFQGGSADGARPRAALVAAAGGVYYGLTFQGGAGNGGTLYQLTISGNRISEHVMHSFPSSAGDGFFPDDESGLLEQNGVLYGTTASGGAGKCACGVVFAIAASSGAPETILYTFKGTHGDGGKPRGSLTADAGGTLYGTAFVGGSKACGSPSGASGCGTVFKITPR